MEFGDSLKTILLCCFIDIVVASIRWWKQISRSHASLLGAWAADEEFVKGLPGWSQGSTAGCEGLFWKQVVWKKSKLDR